MDRKKAVSVFVAIIQIIFVTAGVAVSGFLIYRYGRHGQNQKGVMSETETKTLSEDLPETEPKILSGDSENEQENEGNITELSLKTGAIPESIRVRILADNYSGDVHQSVELCCPEGRMTVRKQLADAEPGTERNGEGSVTEESFEQGERFHVETDDMEEGEMYCVQGTDGNSVNLLSVNRADGPPAYSGKLCLYRETEGIAIVNELPPEEYLCGVVSSEMPSDYPFEAQKAQAVCARTYAVNCIRNSENFLEDLNDSVEFQVYNNYRSTDISRSAVEETKGQILPLSEVLYYSTSCLTESRQDLGDSDSFCEFLKQKTEEGAEYDSPWLRWEVTLSQKQILDNLHEMSDSDLTKVETIEVTKRNGNGQAEKLRIFGNGNSLEVEGEYEIRKVLAPKEAEIILMDGTGVTGMKLLPSGFFCCRAQESDEEEFFIHGGGYGHGCGMSQCGAAAMALSGKNYRQILNYYYNK